MSLRHSRMKSRGGQACRALTAALAVFSQPPLEARLRGAASPALDIAPRSVKSLKGLPAAAGAVVSYATLTPCRALLD
jgi:hypothetical protein